MITPFSLPSNPNIQVALREATVADAWTKGLFVVGPKALKLLEKHPGMQGAIFTPDGRILTTPGLAKSFPARWDTPAKPPR